MSAGLKSGRLSAVKAAGLAFVAGMLATAPVMAQVPDPTRPPGALMAPVPGAAPDSMATDAGVQAVFVRPKGKKSSAIINGQYVEVGGLVGDKRVLKITESEVTLKGATGREVMKVIPAIEKTPVKPPAKNKRNEDKRNKDNRNKAADASATATPATVTSEK
jgi:hypothetical protein